MREGFQAALENADGVVIGAAPHRTPAAAQLVGNRLLPKLGAEGVVGEPVDMLVEAVAEDRFDDFDRLGMQRAPQPDENGAVGDLAGQLVLERVLRRRVRA